MKKLTSRSVIIGLLAIFLVALMSPSCASTRQARLASQRRGLMVMDKSEYTMNSKFKGSKKKSMKVMKKKSRRAKRRMR